MSSDEVRDGFIRVVESQREIAGRFSEFRFLGDGHFSLVFRAKDGTSGRDVALKVFRPDRMGETYRFQCFRREAEILQRLVGQRDVLGWVAPYAEFCHEVPLPSGGCFPLSFPYFALELAASDVATLLDNGSWTAVEILQKFHAMCRGVQRIHRLGIAHRDLKPGNFLVMHDGAIRLSDLGSARDIEGGASPMLPEYLFVPGDTRYTPPEMFALLHDEDPGFAFGGDIFSLGAILFEMFTGSVLGTQIFDRSFGNDLVRCMGIASRGRRRRTYDQFVSAIADGHPLPDVAAFGPCVPAPIRDRVDELYKSMAHIDYRLRLRDFEAVFLKISTCLLILRNDDKYRRWLEQRKKYREQREEKRRRREGVPRRSEAEEENR